MAPIANRPCGGCFPSFGASTVNQRAEPNRRPLIEVQPHRNQESQRRIRTVSGAAGDRQTVLAHISLLKSGDKPVIPTPEETLALPLVLLVVTRLLVISYGLPSGSGRVRFMRHWLERNHRRSRTIIASLVRNVSPTSYSTPSARRFAFDVLEQGVEPKTCTRTAASSIAIQIEEGIRQC